MILKILDKLGRKKTVLDRGPSHPEYGDGNSEFDVNAGTGKVLYIENRQPVSRAVDQIEDIKVVFEF